MTEEMRPMHEQRLKDLIELDLDGIATPAERAELERQLELEPALRDTRNEMRAVHQLLDRRPHVDPPGDFREQIAESVRNAARVRESSPVRFAGGPERRHRVRRFAFALAAVLLIAVILGPSLTKNVDSDHLRGVMAPGASADATWNRIPLDRGEISGSVLTKSEGRELIVRIKLESQSSGQAELTFDPDQLRLSTIAGADRLTESGHLVSDLEESPPELRFERLTNDSVALSLRIIDGSAESSLEIVFP